MAQQGRSHADSQHDRGSGDFLFHNDRSHRKKLLSICSAADIGRIPFVPVVPEVVAVVAHAGLVAVAGEVAVLPIMGEPVGIVGINEPSPTLPALGNALGSGTAGVELTPRLPIS